MTEIIALSQKELSRARILGLVTEGHLSVAAAAERMGLSPRQARRLLRRYEAGGAAGLAHGNRGQPASNRLAAETRERILKLVKEKYQGFNDTHLWETLVEVEKIVIGRETLRSLLRCAGIGPKRKRRPPRHRRRREPRPCRGMMVQWDGSVHPWVGPEGPRWTLMAAVDDADGKAESAHFTASETSAAYFRLLEGVLRHSGAPNSIYQDRHGALRRNDGFWSLEEQLAGEQTPTQVGQALRDLGIRPIFARSPQGKGRIERFFGVAQDRLVAELGCRGITTLEAANRYLQEEWPPFRPCSPQARVGVSAGRESGSASHPVVPLLAGSVEGPRGDDGGSGDRDSTGFASAQLRQGAGGCASASRWQLVGVLPGPSDRRARGDGVERASAGSGQDAPQPSGEGGRRGGAGVLPGLGCGGDVQLVCGPLRLP